MLSTLIGAFTEVIYIIFDLLERLSAACIALGKQRVGDPALKVFHPAGPEHVISSSCRLYFLGSRNQLQNWHLRFFEEIPALLGSQSRCEQQEFAVRELFFGERPASRTGVVAGDLEQRFEDAANYRVSAYYRYPG